MPIKASIIFEMFPFCILYNVRWCKLHIHIKLCSRLLCSEQHGGDNPGRGSPADSVPDHRAGTLQLLGARQAPCGVQVGGEAQYNLSI